MSLWFGAVGFLLAGGLGALLLWRQEKLIGWLVPAFMAGAAILGGISSLKVLLGGVAQIFHAPWSVPFGEFSLRIDSLTAWFLIPTLVLSALSAIYGAQYLEPFRGKNRLGAAWFFYSLLVIGMCFVLTAQNAVLFLFAWELMAVASFFLVTFEHGLDGVREAGWIYFVATHLGTAFLVVFFLTMSRETGSMDFSVWAERGVSGRGLTGLLFLLAIVGFGTKAGLMPFHIWLPEAHTAAPSHVSALMSGAMIKTGIYGMLRTLTFLGAPEDWWGWVLLGLGLMSAILGILFGLMQHDLKRLLAYSSIENMGLITSAIGLGLLAICYRHPLISALSFSAALLHVLNHSLFKGLLFLAAGSVAHATGTRRMDQLGGLLKRMPWTGFLFLFGAAAICGLPPLNGFLSELLLAGSSLVAMTNDSPALAVAGLLALGGLGLVGGLTAAAFTKAFGIVFLGQQRQPFRIEPHEAGLPMKFAMAVLALACIAVVVGAGFVLKGVAPIVGSNQRYRH